MAKRKKKASLSSSTAKLAAQLALDLATVTRDLEQYKAETRFNAAVVRDSISQQTDRIGKQNGQVDQMVRQVNAGFEQVKKDLIRAGQGLTAHERDIANLQQRIFTLETAATTKKGKR